MNTVCPICQQTFQVANEHLGKRARCKKCRHIFVISGPDGYQETSPVTIAESGSPKDRKEQVPLEWQEGDVILDLYEVKRVHTGGGMGLVYRVHHRGWGMDLAVKSPRATYFQNETQKENFVRECFTWMDLGLHPNTVSCYYVRTLGGIPRVFAEYVDGGSLKDWIDSRKLYEGGHEPILRRILDIAIQFAWGLHYAHENGLVHQDVKPANVLMTPDGITKVTDFGLAMARAVAGEQGLSVGQSGQTLVVRGAGLCTREYASPEQVAGDPLTRKTDIWSWGVSVLELFTGIMPPYGPAAGEVLENYLQTGPEENDLPPMPDPVVDLLRHCFQKNPEDRPESMAHISEILQSLFKQITTRNYGRKQPGMGTLQADSFNNRGLSLIDLGQKEEARQVFNEALRLDSGHPETRGNLSVLSWTEQWLILPELPARIADITRISNLRPETLYQVAWLWTQAGDYDRACEVLEPLIKNGGKKPNIYNLLGVSLWRMDRFEEARQAFQKAVALDPNNADYRANHALTIGDLTGPEENPLQYGSNIVDISSLTVGRILSPVRPTRVFEGLATYCTSENISSFHLDPVQGPRDIPRHVCFGVTDMCFSPDENVLLSVGGGTNPWEDSSVKIWDTTTGKCTGCLEGHIGSVNSVDIDAWGIQAVTGGKDGTVRLWHVPERRIVRVLEGHSEEVRAAVFSPDGRLAASGDAKGTVLVWNVTDGRCLQKSDFPGEEVEDLHFAADSRTLAVGHFNGALRTWDVSSGQCIKKVDDLGLGLTCLDFSPDGEYLLVVNGKKGVCRLYHMPRMEPYRSFLVQSQWVHTCAFSPKGDVFATGSHDGTICVWQLDTGRCLRVFRPSQNLTRPSETHVKCVAFSPRTEYLAGATFDGPPHLWNMTRDDGHGCLLRYSCEYVLCRPRSTSDVLTNEERFVGLLGEAEGLLRRRDIRAAYGLFREAQKIPGYERDDRVLKGLAAIAQCI